MLITPEKVIKSKIELTNDEYDTLTDYKLVLERMKHGIQLKGITEAAGLNIAFIESEIATVALIMDRVSILPEV